MSNRKTPILTHVALADTWSSGYLRLRAEGGWPASARIPGDVSNDICGMRGWEGRRRAMREIAGMLAGDINPERWRAAKLLAADPKDADACREIAEMLADELPKHDQTKAAADAIEGWNLLASGFSLASDDDPIEAARAAFDAARHVPLSAEAPSPEELASAPVLDDWEMIEIPASTNRAVRGVISGSIKYESGQLYTTAAVEKNDLDMTWIRTAESVYRLGYRLSDHAPIVQVVLKRTARAAYNTVYGITGACTLPEEVRDAALVAGDEAAAASEKRKAAKEVGDALALAGRKAIAHAWSLLAADGEDMGSCKLAYFFLLEDAGDTQSTEVKTVLMGWQMMSTGLTLGEDMSDSIAAAHRIGDRHARNDALLKYDDPVPAETDGARDGVMVVKRVGGTKETSSGKEAQREFKDIAGQRIPLARVPDIKRVRQVLRDEFPHARRQVDTLLTGMVEGDPIRWRNSILVGSSAGGGKSRLVRRLAEMLGVGLQRFDASGSSDNTFGGTPRRWSSGEHCVPLEAVRRYRAANPLVMVDEIDKAGTSRHNGNLVSTLLPFLEKETAKAYPDPFVQTECDLSHVGFVLTCNSEVELPGPLRDRLLIVHLPDPSIEHMPALIRSIVADIAREQGGDRRWLPMLDDGELFVAEELWGGGSVRRLRAIVERILAYREDNPRN